VTETPEERAAREEAARLKAEADAAREAARLAESERRNWDRLYGSGES
jgi:hypothetical protein